MRDAHTEHDDGSQSASGSRPPAAAPRGGDGAGPDGRDASAELTIGEAADLLGVTVRTLRHWDAIGLLTPEWRTWGGHRLYLAADLSRAHRILVYREAGVPLAEIRDLIDGDADERAQLARQREVLVERVSHLRRMIGAVDRLLEAIDMNQPMTPQEAAEHFGVTWRQDWEDEARERWGDTDAWAQAAERRRGFTKDDWARMAEGQDRLVGALAAAVRDGEAPDSARGRDIARMHRELIAEHFDCDHGRQAILARMYREDPRWRPAYDDAGGRGAPGALAWLCDAIDAAARAAGVDPAAAEW